MKAFAYKAALYCEHCARAIIASLEKTTGKPPLELREDSDYWPQGPYANGGGEADCPQHCDQCGAFLENPLTNEGRAHVREALENVPWSWAAGDSKPNAARDIWSPFYKIFLS